MEKKLERICEEDIKIGERYCITESILSDEFIFEVTEIYSNDFLRLKFLDGVILVLGKSSVLNFYKFPYSSLEKELT
jgi:hypothetical protein